MSPSEWLDIAATIAERWPHAAMPEETVIRWGNDLSDLDASQVEATIEALYRDGREYPPNPGVIRRKLTELALDLPDWATALHEMQTWASAPSGSVIAAGHTEERDGIEVYVIDSERFPRREVLAAAHPMVRAFVEAVGEAQVIEGAEPEAGGADEARLREKWLGFARARTRDIAYAGIADAGLPALRRANSQPRELGQGGIGRARAALEAARE